MDNERAIGGYFELDGGGGTSALPDGVLLNSGRNALRHIVRKLGIRSIHVPYYICPVVADALKAEGCEIDRYSLGDDMFPGRTFPVDDFVLYVNYFGVCGRKVDMLAQLYPNLIVDCAQAYFARPKGRTSFASPRKFFGVPDGGVAYRVETSGYNQDVDSEKRMAHLFERRDNGATPQGYAMFRKSEASLDGAEILAMSAITRNILSKTDLRSAKERRIRNFAYLGNCLPTNFPIDLSEDDVPMVYPYMTDDPGLRMRLVENGIYVATYWPGVSDCDSLCERILPLPIDQRYDESDVKKIVEMVNKQA